MIKDWKKGNPKLELIDFLQLHGGTVNKSELIKEFDLGVKEIMEAIKSLEQMGQVIFINQNIVLKDKGTFRKKSFEDYF